MNHSSNSLFQMKWYLAAAVSAAVFLGGCQVGSRPRLRVSDYFGSPTGMRFPDPKNLGRHCLDDCRDEKLGIVYTCQGGFIDLGHLREAADRTHYLAQVSYQNLMKTNTNFSFRVIEPTYYEITLSYPDGWIDLPIQKKKVLSRSLASQLGQYLAHTSLIWHEILTWYGFSSAGVFSENISAFSFEDPYSDAMGTVLAATVLQEPACFYDETAYEEAMTALIDETLNELHVQSSEVAKRAAKIIKGRWYKGGYYFFVDMRKRNLDVGFDDGLITPWRVSNVCPYMEIKPCPVPNFTFLDDYGFKIKVRLRPVEYEKEKIYAAAGLGPSDRIIPHIHFPRIIECIRKEAIQLEGKNVDKPGKKNND